jgi:hypothetical protein
VAAEGFSAGKEMQLMTCGGTRLSTVTVATRNGEAGGVDCGVKITSPSLSLDGDEVLEITDMIMPGSLPRAYCAKFLGVSMLTCNGVK